MAQFRNVSGVARRLALPDWFEPKDVEPDGTVDVDDSLVYTGPPEPEVVDGVQQPIPANHHLGTYGFNQPGVWELVEAPKSTKKNGGN